MSLVVLFSGAVSPTIVAPAASSTASRGTTTIGVPKTVVVTPAVATATSSGLAPLDSRVPLNLLVPGSFPGTLALTLAPAAVTATAAAVAPVVRTTIVAPAPNVTAARGTVQFAMTVISPACNIAASRSSSPPLVMPLATPAANVRAEQLRLASPTGQQEPGYINVTLRQLV
jgi:hypothetical protein